MTGLTGRTARAVVHALSDALAFHATRAGEGHAFMTASVVRRQDAVAAARQAYAMVAEELRANDMDIVHERVFGSLSREFVVMQARQETLGEWGVPCKGPVSYVQGAPPWGEGLAGVTIHAVKADKVWLIADEGQDCGRGWQRGGATYFVLQGLPARGGGGRASQAGRMIERAERILGRYGASYRDVVRTWFYLDDILDWYPEFNKARNERYGVFGIMPGPGDDRLLLPASSGIGGETSSGAPAVMDLFAIVREPGGCPAVKQMTSRGQLDAFRYGSAFSRGALIRERDVAIVEISGTAAIDERGVSLHPGDAKSQIHCTFDKIEGLLKPAGGALRDICAATVFVKRPEDAGLFWNAAAARGLSDFPAVCVVADVCRDELLFEIDGEAVLGLPPPKGACGNA